jgi:nitrile hydratase subunit alpha
MNSLEAKSNPIGALPPAMTHKDPAARVAALESLLIAKGYLDPQAVDAIIDLYQNEIGPRYGAKVVARAWTDPAFKTWLLKDATAALASMGYTGRQGEHVVALESTPQTHHMVVCTLCSCYPWSVLGLPPVWYKSPAYRAKAVIDPQGVLTDFGTQLPAGQAIQVWDSTAEVRYLVIPQQPFESQGLPADQLEAWVTRDSMIGVGIAKRPASPMQASEAQHTPPGAA